MRRTTHLARPSLSLRGIRPHAAVGMGLEPGVGELCSTG
jgi:hypothetical protein